MQGLRLILPVLAVLAGGLFLMASAGPGETERARKFVEAHVAKLRPLELEASKAWWDASVTGKDEDFKKKEEAQNRIDEALANAEAFQELKAIKTGGGKMFIKCVTLYLTKSKLIAHIKDLHDVMLTTPIIMIT